MVNNMKQFSKEYYLVFSSATSAQRLSKLLSAEGIKSNMVHTPKAVSDGGCGYSLIIQERHLYKSVHLAEEYGIKIRKTAEKKN